MAKMELQLGSVCGKTLRAAKHYAISLAWQLPQICTAFSNKSFKTNFSPHCKSEVETWTNESFSFAFQLEVSSQKLSGSCYPEDFVLFSSMKLFHFDEECCVGYG